MNTVTMAEPGASATTARTWSLPARVAFRFLFIYFTLYCLADQIIQGVVVIPKVDAPELDTIRPFRDIVFWVGAHLFGMKAPLVFSGSGSGDKHFDWVVAFCILLTSAAGAAIWTALDRGRRNYARLQQWFLLFLRLCLGGQMISYGMVKAIPLQMPYPYLGRLMERYGDLSPMGVLWASVGASPAYETFAGCAEMLGGLLLISRRTRTLGTLICLADMTHVFVLNMTYDVPVKLLSFHLILIALLILGPDLKRLGNFFLLARAADAPGSEALFTSRRAQRIAMAVVAFLWVWMLANNAYSIHEEWYEYGPGAQKSPLYGIWNIQDESLDGKPQPLTVTDASAWRSIIFEFPQYAQVVLMDGRGGYRLALDPNARSITFSSGGDKNWHASFTFTRTAFDRLTLDGTIAGQKALLHLQRVDEKKFPLERGGFHWVQDYPVNR